MIMGLYILLTSYFLLLTTYFLLLILTYLVATRTKTSRQRFVVRTSVNRVVIIFVVISVKSWSTFITVLDTLFVFGTVLI